MSVTNPSKQLAPTSRRPRAQSIRVSGTLLIAFPVMVEPKMHRSTWFLPVVTRIFFVLACLVALVASLRDRACVEAG